MNIKTRPIEQSEYELLIKTISEGYIDENGIQRKPNRQVATVLCCETNLGCRIGDILRLKLNNFEIEDNIVRIKIIEKKTGKLRNFSCSMSFYNFLLNYCMSNGITKREQRIFDVGERNVQIKLKQCCKHLEHKGLIKNANMISTHSFRKRGARDLMENSNMDASIVCQWLNHSDMRTTLKYLGITNVQLENILNKNTNIPNF